MLDTKEFSKIREGMDAEDARREEIIKESRDVLKKSKQAIYEVHRGNVDEAEKLLASVLALKKKLDPKVSATSRTGSYAAAMEEYVEAAVLVGYVKTGAIITLKELAVEPEEYLAGLADVTGELMRRAVLVAIKKDVAEVERIHDVINQLYGQFVQFDFRNGDLRRKYDSIKYNLQKVERTLYDLHLGDRGA